MVGNQRRNLLLAMSVGLLAVAWAYRETFASIATKWVDDASFSHGFLILPISLWLVWRKRLELATVDWRPSWGGVVALVAAVVTWVVAKGTGVLVVEQLAGVAMIPAMVLAILGGSVFRVLAFPLFFLLFAVPFGRGLVPLFMQLTADVATWALEMSGVPIYRTNMFINIPSGTFEVAKACSGLAYVITGLVLGVLYAYLTFTKWSKRFLCVLAFLVVPIIANGLRVYFTIAVSHLTEMRWGPGTEHVTFGRIFFIVVMLLMFWIGRRWHDDVPTQATFARRPFQPQFALSAWVPVPFAVAAALIGPLYLGVTVAQAARGLGSASELVTLPTAAAGWQGLSLPGSAWKPLYVKPLAEQSGSYVDSNGMRVDVYIGVYGLGTTGGSEMISYNNRISATDNASLAHEIERDIVLSGRTAFHVREQEVRDSTGEHLVWHWFMVGDRHATNAFMVKALEARAFLLGDVRTERILTLSTPLDSMAEGRLHAFVAAHADCMVSGMDASACR